jgi:hypothetical protein
MAALRRAIVEAATEEDVHAVMNSLKAAALQGDATAAKAWLDHILGKAPQSVQVSSMGSQKLDFGTIIEVIFGALRNDLKDEAAARVKVSAAFRNANAASSQNAESTRDLHAPPAGHSGEVPKGTAEHSNGSSSVTCVDASPQATAGSNSDIYEPAKIRKGGPGSASNPIDI